MKKMAFAVMGVFVAGSAVAAAPDWGKVPVRKVTLFYPGQASLEWVMNAADHSAVPDITKKKRFCAKCHEGDANEIGDKMAKGQPVGSSKSVLEPKPVAGKAGHIPVNLQAAHDGEHIYFRLEWESPKAVGEKMDKKNAVKATLMFDGGVGTVEGAEINGCWSTCHDDLRTMRHAKSDDKKKYVKGADLAAGRFYDYIQFRSSEPMVDGYIADDRVREGGKSLVKAEGKKQGNKWVVTFQRKLAGLGKGDHTIAADKVYDFGFAIHEGSANYRYHYVSLGYQFGLDKPGEAKNYIAVPKM